MSFANFLKTCLIFATSSKFNNGLTTALIIDVSISTVEIIRSIPSSLRAFSSILIADTVSTIFKFENFFCNCVIRNLDVPIPVGQQATALISTSSIRFLSIQEPKCIAK